MVSTKDIRLSTLLLFFRGLRELFTYEQNFIFIEGRFPKFCMHIENRIRRQFCF